MARWSTPLSVAAFALALTVQPAPAQQLPPDERCSELGLAIMNGSSDLAAMIPRLATDLKHCDIDLHFAARYGRTDVVTKFLAMGVDPNAQDESQNTPLMHAADGPDNEDRRSDRAALLRVVRQLIAAKADINFAIPNGTRKGKRAIHFALGKGDVAMVKALIDYGADIWMEGTDPDASWSPLEWAITSEEPPMVAFILSLGPNVAGSISRAKSFLYDQRRMEQQRNIFPNDKYEAIERLLSSR